MVAQPRSRSPAYLVMAALAVLLALVGFSRRYGLALAQGTLRVQPIVHVHAVITFGWLALLVAQTALVASGRTARHRGLGLLGVAVGALLVFTATEIALLQLARELGGEGASPREFVATLLSLALMTSGLLWAGFATVTRPEVHKRMMVLATCVILTPALARLIQLVDPSLIRLPRNDLAGLASDALVLAAIAHDWRSRGRPHAAYLVGAACIAAVQVGTLAVRTTPAWVVVTDWLASLAA